MILENYAQNGMTNDLREKEKSTLSGNFSSPHLRVVHESGPFRLWLDYAVLGERSGLPAALANDGLAAA